MEIIADFHSHSKYSRATSSEMNLDDLSRWAKYKGITVLGTGDCTHPVWMSELEAKLTAGPGGFYEYHGVAFVPTAEVNTIFYVTGTAKKIHHVLIIPTLEEAKRINARLGRYGDLLADGRPTLMIHAAELVKIVLDLSPRSLIVPAHAWTPHFSVFGSNSGFDTVEACFGEQAKYIYALETGLSSDPAMNWRLSALDRYGLISNSDSHSPSRIGREANVFDTELAYDAIIAAIKARDPRRFLYTIEFFPEEGKYHFDGHRTCQARLSPEETRNNNFLCPVCSRKVTVGVMHRVEKLADRPEGHRPPNAIGFKHMIPLDQIIADAKGMGVDSQAVEREYFECLKKLGTEMEILFKVPEETLRRELNPRVAEGIIRVQQGRVKIAPGYDGEYGHISIFAAGETIEAKERQLELF